MLAVVNNRQERIDKETFKQIFIDHFSAFQDKYSRFKEEYFTKAVEKMLGCAEEENGFAKYICPTCHETKVVPFSCKSYFCLSCAKIRLDEWLNKIEDILFDEVEYRHVILTMPEKLRNYFFEVPNKLNQFIQCGIEMLKDLMKEVHGDEIEFGYIVVLQTAGRSSGYNPHLHIMMTAGGIDKKDKWHDINYIPFDLLHKKWQYYLFTMMKKEFGKDIEPLIDKLYKKYPKGIVAHIKMEKVPKREQLAKYLMKYVGSPPIALSRIVEYNEQKQTVTYWYKDHITNEKKVEEVSVMTFIGRMVQHILPEGFKRVRYYGLHATCKRNKVAEKLKEIFYKVKTTVKKVFKGFRKKNKKYRERIKELTGRDPFKCSKCGGEMMLLEIWVPGYGTIYDELEEIERGKYDPIDFEEEKLEKGGDESSSQNQIKYEQLLLW